MVPGKANRPSRATLKVGSASRPSSATTSDNQPPKKRKFSEECESEPFKFVVGADKTVFYVHKAIMSKQSPALEVLIYGPMHEAQEGVAYWPDVDADTFRAFVQFVYTDSLLPGFLEPTAGCKAEDLSDILQTAAKLYLLAEYYSIPSLEVTASTQVHDILRTIESHFELAASKESRRHAMLAITNFVSFCFDPVARKPDMLRFMAMNLLTRCRREVATAREIWSLLDDSHELAAELCKHMLDVRTV